MVPGSGCKPAAILKNYQEIYSMQKNDFTLVESWSVSDLIDALTIFNKKRKIIIPKYQRSLVWAESQKKMFIESIKDGFPIGSLLLYKTDESNGISNYSLTDGLQRTSTLLDYSRKPTKYFDTDNIDENLVVIINELFGNKKTTESDIKRCIVSWVNKRNGFEERDGFSSQDLAENIDIELSLDLTKEDGRKLRIQLLDFIKAIKEQSDIFDFKIPIVIYTGSQENLPVIFERLNRQGTQLSKYQIYAATWANEKFKISNRNIIENISAKYQKLIEEGLKIENYSPENVTQFEKDDFTFFEYIFGLGKLLTNKFPDVFNADKNEDESIGFNLSAVCLGVSIKQMHNLPKIFKIVTNGYIEQQKFETALFNSIEKAIAILKPYISIKLNKNKDKPTIYHTEFQFISIVSKIFKTIYSNTDLSINQDIKGQLILLEKYIPQYYLFHILQGYWNSSGDSKAISESNSDNYGTSISIYKWEDLLNSWCAEEAKQKHRSRQGLKDSSRLFLKYIYTHLVTTHDEKSSKIFEIEHLVPVALLEDLKNEHNGIAMNHIGNLALLDKKLNNQKKDQTLYQYVYRNRNIIDIKAVEKLTFTQKEDLDFVGVATLKTFDLNDNLDFVNKRFTVLKKAFYDLNKIQPIPSISQKTLFEKI